MALKDDKIPTLEGKNTRQKENRKTSTLFSPIAVFSLNENSQGYPLI
jgi:hypothetical protein